MINYYKKIRLQLGRWWYETNPFLLCGIGGGVPTVILLVLVHVLNLNFSSKALFIGRGIYLQSADDRESALIAIVLLSGCAIIIGFALQLIYRNKSVTLLKQQWSYILYREKNQLFLSVVAGTVGIYNVTIQLNQAERESYWLEGEQFINTLAKNVREKHLTEPLSSRVIKNKR